MNEDLLNKYFAKKCSEEESRIVEEWLLDINNQSLLDNFLEKRWANHIENDNTNINKRKTTISFFLKIAAVFLIVFGIYTSLHMEHKEISIPNQNLSNTKIAKSIEDTSSIKQELTSKKTISNPRKKTIKYIAENKDSSITANSYASIDSTVKPKTKEVKASKISNFKINEIALVQFKDKIDSNTMILNVDVNNASFDRLAGLLYTQYGIILEPCSASITTKTYTAKFEKVSIKDLLSDMSNKLMFTYSMKDNKISICFE